MNMEFFNILMEINIKFIHINFKGDFKNDLKDGYGEYIWKDGDKYEV